MRYKHLNHFITIDYICMNLLYPVKLLHKEVRPLIALSLNAPKPLGSFAALTISSFLVIDDNTTKARNNHNQVEKLKCIKYLLGCTCPSLWLFCHFPLSISPKWSLWFLHPGLLDSFEASSLSLHLCLVSCASWGLTQDNLVHARSKDTACGQGILSKLLAFGSPFLASFNLNFAYDGSLLWSKFSPFGIKHRKGRH